MTLLYDIIIENPQIWKEISTKGFIFRFPFHKIQLKVQNLEHNQSRGYLCIKDANKVERVFRVISFSNEPLVKTILSLQCMARMTMIPKRDVSEDEENWKTGSQLFFSHEIGGTPVYMNVHMEP